MSGRPHGAWWASAPAAAGFSTLVAAAMVLFHYRPEGLAPWEGDAVLFYRMAEEWPWRPGGWWQYRILCPFLVHALPLTTNQGYALIATLSIGGSGWAVNRLIGDLGLGSAARGLGLLLFLTSFAVLYNSFNYALPDPLAMLIALLACRAIVRGRDLELAIWLVLGALTKEVVLFLVPVRWLWSRESGIGVAALTRTALIALPAAIVFVALRAMPGEAEELTGFVSGNAWLFPWKHQPDNLARVYSPFAAGWALYLVSLRRPDRWTRASLGFVIPCLLSLLVTDAGRMLVYLTPFAIPAILRSAGADENVSRRGLAAVLLAAASQRMWEPFAPLYRVPVLIRRGLALALAPVCAWLAISARPSSPSRRGSSPVHSPPRTPGPRRSPSSPGS